MPKSKLDPAQIKLAGMGQKDGYDAGSEGSSENLEDT
jgi:hypothetical protein